MKSKLALATALAVMAVSASHAGIVKISELGLDGDAPAEISTGFGEDQLTFSDRDHQHNGAAFDAADTLVTPTGPTIVPLPGYLVGNDYVRFANNARDNAGYSATFATDDVSAIDWYLLVDNRLDGPAGNTSSSNTTDPVLGGTLQWIVSGGWERVDTGISPAGQADYTAVDEGGNGVGAGMELNQFYSVYKYPISTNVVTVFSNGIGGSNMISLVTSIPEPSTGLLALLGLLGLGIFRRKRK